MELIHVFWKHRANKLSSPVIEEALGRYTDLGQNPYLKNKNFLQQMLSSPLLSSGLLEKVVKMANIQQSLFSKLHPCQNGKVTLRKQWQPQLLKHTHNMRCQAYLWRGEALMFSISSLHTSVRNAPIFSCSLIYKSLPMRCLSSTTCLCKCIYPSLCYCWAVPWDKI